MIAPNLSQRWAPLDAKIAGWSLDRSGSVLIVIVGLGSIGAPLARNLRQLGFRRFVLIDPKTYRESSLGWQCGPDDLGRFKVDVTADELRASGASVLAFAESLDSVDPGFMAGNAIFISAVDNESAVRQVGDAAARHRCPMVRISLEPSHPCVTVRTVDYRSDTLPSCIICNWGADEYAQQLSTKSCTPDQGRSTHSPRALSEAAAGFGAMTVTGIAASDSDQPVDDRQHLIGIAGPYHVASVIDANPNCRCRQGLPPKPIIVRESVADVSFADLASRAKFNETASLSVSGSGRFAQGARCHRCRADAPIQRWITDLDRIVGRCRCGGECRPVPFRIRRALTRRELGVRWTDSMRSLGVTSRAAVDLSDGERHAAFVLSPLSPPK